MKALRWLWPEYSPARIGRVAGVLYFAVGALYAALAPVRDSWWYLAIAAIWLVMGGVNLWVAHNSIARWRERQAQSREFWELMRQTGYPGSYPPEDK